MKVQRRTPRAPQIGARRGVHDNYPGLRDNETAGLRTRRARPLSTGQLSLCSRNASVVVWTLDSSETPLPDSVGGIGVRVLRSGLAMASPQQPDSSRNTAVSGPRLRAYRLRDGVLAPPPPGHVGVQVTAARKSSSQSTAHHLPAHVASGDGATRRGGLDRRRRDSTQGDPA